MKEFVGGPENFILVYDSGCTSCVKFKRLVDRLDRYNRLRYMSLETADELGHLDPVPRDLRHKSFHLVSPDRLVSSGSEAVPDLIQILPLGGIAARVIRTAPFGRAVIDYLYATLSRLHDTGPCSYGYRAKR